MELFFIDVNETMMELHRKLHRACIKGDVDTVNNLLRINKEKIDAKQLNQMGTLLRTVSHDKFFPSLEQLQEEMEKDPSEQVVKLLCEMGVDLEQKDYSGETALHLAVRGNKRTNSSFEFHANPRIVKILLEHGASVHAKDDYGQTPLHEACWRGNLEVVQTLMKHHANVHATCNTGETSLHKACVNGHLEIVQELLKHQPDVDAIIENGIGQHFTPLMIAAAFGFSEIAEELLKNGADVNLGPFYGSSLHLAIKYHGHSEIAKILLKNRCNTNVRAKLGHDVYELSNCTAFELALDIKSMGIVKMIAFHEI